MVFKIFALVVTLAAAFAPMSSFAKDLKKTASLKKVNLPYNFYTVTANTDPYGNVYVAGYGTQPIPQVGNLINGYDAKVAKINPETGAVIWEKYLPLSDSGNSDLYTQIKITSTAVYLLANVSEGPLPPTNGSVYSPNAYHMTMKLVKLNPISGETISITSLTDTVLDASGNSHHANVMSAGLDVSANGDVAIIGQTGTWNGLTEEALNGAKLWYVARINSSGQLVWMKRAGGSYAGYIGAIANNIPVRAIFNNDNIVVIGQYDNQLTMADLAINQYALDSGDLISENVYSNIGGYSISSVDAITVKNNDLYVTAGSFNISGKFGGLIFKSSLTQIAPSILNFMQSTGLYTKFKKLEVADSGNIYLAGTYDPTTEFSAIDGFVSKYDASGALQWTNFKNGVGNGIDFGSSVQIDCNERVYLTSNFQSTSEDYDIGLNTYTKDGASLSELSYDGAFSADDYVYFTMKSHKYHMIFAKGGEFSPSPTTPYLMLTELSKCVGVNNVANTALNIGVGVSQE